MDTFSNIFHVVCLFVQSIVQLAFIGRMSGKSYRARHMALYFVCLLVLSAAAVKSTVINMLAIAIQMVILYALNRLVLRASRPAALLTATLADYICQLSFGMTNSVESVIFPHFVGTPVLYLLLIVTTAAAFAICIGCYALNACRAVEGAGEISISGKRRAFSRFAGKGNRTEKSRVVSRREKNNLAQAGHDGGGGAGGLRAGHHGVCRRDETLPAGYPR